MPRLLTRIICLTGLLLTAGIATAAELPAAPERYEVELIVFRHVDQSRNTPEIPAAASIFRASPLDLTLTEIPAPPPQILATPLTIPDNDPSRRVHRPPISFQLNELNPTYPDFVPLRDDTHTLNRVYERLERIAAYEPIVHVGWVQPARNTDSAKPYRFEQATTGDVGIAGTVTLYKERYLHLDINLTLETAMPPVEAQFVLKAGVNEPPGVHKLTESRRIRGTTAHYFDSPQFGVITRIQEVHAAATRREEAG